MSDYSKIIARLKKNKIEYNLKKKTSQHSNSVLVFGAVRMYFSPAKNIVGICIFDMRVDIDNFIETWRNK